MSARYALRPAKTHVPFPISIMKTAKIATAEVSDWMRGQLSHIPETIHAVYIEWNNSYLAPNTPREVAFVSMTLFGFKHLKKGTFDCSDGDQLSKLGDFDLVRNESLKLDKAEFPKLDWTGVLKKAAVIPAVRTLVRRRDLLLLVGYHDDDVYDVS